MTCHKVNIRRFSIIPILLLQHIKMSSLQTKRGEGCIDSHGDIVSKVRIDKLCAKLPFCPFLQFYEG